MSWILRLLPAFAYAFGVWVGWHLKRDDETRDADTYNWDDPQ
jgi:hypothetical protein